MNETGSIVSIAAKQDLSHTFSTLNANQQWKINNIMGIQGDPPQCHVYPQEIAGLIKGLLTTIIP